MIDRARTFDRRVRPSLRRWETWVTPIAVLPILAALARALADGWIPMGEDAIFPLRARDVFTANHPFLGTFSSASLTSGTTVNHPGPLLFDVLALPVRLFGSAAGVVLGVALINAVSVLVACLAARRAGGRTLLVWVAAGAIGLEWTLGSSLLIDPWNPHVVLLPFFAMLVCAVAFAAGQRWTLAWVIGFGSFALQTHVSYALLVPAVSITALAGAWWRDRRPDRRPDRRGPTASTEMAEPWRPHVIVAVVWFLVLWAQPLWQQFAGSGPGNLRGLLGSASDGQEHAGLGLAARLVTQVVALPPTWARASFLDSLQDLPLRGADGSALPLPGWVPSAASAAFALGALLVLLAGIGALALRRRRWDAVFPMALAVVCVGAACWSAASVPAGGYGIAPHQLRWLWPIAVFWMVSVGAVLTPWLRSSLRPARLGWLVASALAIGALAGCVRYEPKVGVARAPGSPASVESIVSQVRRASFPPVLLDGAGLWIGEPFTAPMLEGLYRDDRPVYVEHQQAAQVGFRREVNGSVRARMYLRSGAAAMTCRAHEARLAVTTALSAEAAIAFEQTQSRVVALATSLVTAVDPALLGARSDLLAAMSSDDTIFEWVTSGRFAVDATGVDLELYLSPEDRALVDGYEPVRASLGVDTVGVFVAARDPAQTGPIDLTGVSAGSPTASCPAGVP